jgi:hypothetical protein
VTDVRSDIQDGGIVAKSLYKVANRSFVAAKTQRSKDKNTMKQEIVVESEQLLNECLHSAFHTSLYGAVRRMVNDLLKPNAMTFVPKPSDYSLAFLNIFSELR